MKTMTSNKVWIWLQIILLLAMPLLTYVFFLRGTRTVSEIKITVSSANTPSGQNELRISPETQERLRKTIQSAYKAHKTKDLIDIFEREREHYLVIITILLGFLVLIGGYAAIQKLFEKEHLENLEELIEKSKREIVAVKNIKYVYDLDHFTYSMRFNQDFYLASKKKDITEIDEFRQLLEKHCSNFLQEVRNTPFDDAIVRIPYRIYNLIDAGSEYAKKRKFNNKKRWDVTKNKILESVLKICGLYYKQKEMSELKDLLRDIHTPKAINFE